MPKQYLYNVFDNKTNKQIGTGITCTEVRELTNAGKISLSNHVVYGYKINGRYSVTVSSNTIKENLKMKKELWDEWDKMFQVAQMIQNGKAKIVTEIVNGREVKYTVPIGG